LMLETYREKLSTYDPNRYMMRRDLYPHSW